MNDHVCLDSLDDASLDHLPFGVICLGPTGTIQRYNQVEAERAGTQRWRVLGRDFFHDLAGDEGSSLAKKIRQLPPGAAMTVPFRFRRYRRVDDVMMDVSRSTKGHTYLCIRSAR